MKSLIYTLFAVSLLSVTPVFAKDKPIWECSPSNVKRRAIAIDDRLQQMEELVYDIHYLHPRDDKIDKCLKLIIAEMNDVYLILGKGKCRHFKE